MTEKDEYTLLKESEFKKGKLFYFIGLPRSGKSTFSKKWRSESINRVVVNGDTFRYCLSGKGYSAEHEEEFRKIYYISIKALLFDGYDVLVDETNTRLESRKQWDDLGGEQIYIDTPLDVCLNRVVGSDNDYAIAAFKKAMIKMDKNIKDNPPKVDPIKL